MSQSTQKISAMKRAWHVEYFSHANQRDKHSRVIEFKLLNISMTPVALTVATSECKEENATKEEGHLLDFHVICGVIDSVLT